MRKLMITLLLILMLAIGGGTFAQDATTFCGDLAEADCTLLTESNSTMTTLTSATFDFVVNLTTSGVGEGSDGTFSLSGDGSFAGDLGGLAMTDIDTMNLDPAAAVELAKGALTAFSGELNLGLAAPEMGLPEGMLAFNLRLVDGVGYLNFESLGLLLGGPAALEQMGLPTSWGGLNLIDVIDQGMAAMGDMSELEGQMDEAMGDQVAMQDDVMALANNYANIERGADDGGLAVFVTTFDFAGMFADPAFQELLAAQIEAQGETVSAEEMQEAVAMLGQMGQSLNFIVSTKVNPDTKFVESTVVDGSLDLGAIGAAANDPSVQGILTINATFNAADFNSAPAITAPEGAPVATFADLMALFGSMGGGF